MKNNQESKSATNWSFGLFKILNTLFRGKKKQLQPLPIIANKSKDVRFNKNR